MSAALGHDHESAPATPAQLRVLIEQFRYALARLPTDEDRRTVLFDVGFCLACGTDLIGADGKRAACYCESDE